MIWIVLSLILGTVLVFHEAQRSLRQQGDFLFTKISEFDFVKLFFSEGMKSALAPTVAANLAMSGLQAAVRIRGIRANTLRLAMSTLAFLPLLLWSNLVFAVNGSFVMGIAGVLYLVLSSIAHNQVRILKAFARFLFFAGVAMMLFEQMMRMGSQVMMVAHEYEWIFVLSIGSFLNGLQMFVVAFALSFVLQISGWSFIISLALLMTGLFAFNNAIFFIAGELLAWPWVVYFSLRGCIPSLKKWYMQFSFIHSAGVLLAGIILVGFRNEIFSSEVASISQMEVRHQALIAVFAILIFIPFSMTMLWGHFMSLQKPEEMESTKISKLPQLLHRIESRADLIFLQSALEQRLHALEDQHQELKKQDYAAVPAPLLQKHRAELQTVKDILGGLKHFGTPST